MTQTQSINEGLFASEQKYEATPALTQNIGAIILGAVGIIVFGALLFIFVPKQLAAKRNINAKIQQETLKKQKAWNQEQGKLIADGEASALEYQQTRAKEFIQIQKDNAKTLKQETSLGISLKKKIIQKGKEHDPMIQRHQKDMDREQKKFDQVVASHQNTLQANKDTMEIEVVQLKKRNAKTLAETGTQLGAEAKSIKDQTIKLQVALVKKGLRSKKKKQVF